MYPGLLCQIRGSGASRSLSDPIFYKNSVLLEASLRINGSTLTFPTFTAEDQGQYECGCSSTLEKSNNIILFVTSPKSEAPPPSFVVKYGNEVTISCPLNFITFGDLPTFYKVDWRNSQGVNQVDGSIVVSPAVSFDNQTLQLMILNVTSDEEYRCVITQFRTTRFSDARPSDPVRIHELGHQRVSVELSQPTIATGQTTTINCSQASPSYNPRYKLELVEDGSTETKVYYTSVYTYTAKSASVNVTCTVMQHSNSTMLQEMVNDNDTQRIFVVGIIQLNGNELKVQDDKGCIQVLRVEYTSTPTTMELMYTITPDPNELCPPATPSMFNTKNTSVSTDRNLHVNLTGVTYDGTRVDLYVRAWMIHDGVNGKCSDAVKLERADETCYGVIPTRYIVGIAVAALLVGIIVIATPVVACILFCHRLRRSNQIDFPKEDPRERTYRKSRKKGLLKKTAATNTTTITDRTKKAPMAVEEKIEMTSNPAYGIARSLIRHDRPIYYAELRLEDRQSDTIPLVHNEVKMSGVKINHPQTGSDTTAANISLESPPSIYNNQSIGQYKTLSRTDTQQPSNTVSSDSSCITQVTSDKWWILGGTHTIVATSCGGEWSLSPFSGKRSREACCAVLTAPRGVVDEGIELWVEYCVILDGPFLLPSNYVRVSVAVYLNCDETLLRKPLEVKLCHWAAPDEENDSHFSERLSFLKAPHKVAEGQDSHHFEPTEGAEFHTSTSTGILSLKDHFCLICIACERSGPQEERINKRCYAMLWEGEVEESSQQFRIVVMYAVPSWKQVTREYYLSEKRGRLRYDEIIDFVFTKDCILHLETTKDKGKGWMLQQLRAKLYQDSLSLSNLTEMECEDKIHEVRSGLYPPAMRFVVGYNPPPPENCGRLMSRANLQGVREDIGFSFAILDSTSEWISRAHRESTPKEYQLDPISIEDYVIPKMSDKWKEFGIRLGIQNAMLDSIYKSNFGNTVDCCRAVLDYWMSSSSREVSWDKVIQAMKDCERKRQASELEDHLSEKVSGIGSLSSGIEEC